jgi:hypothetical protein
VAPIEDYQNPNDDSIICMIMMPETILPPFHPAKQKRGTEKTQEAKGDERLSRSFASNQSPLVFKGRRTAPACGE